MAAMHQDTSEDREVVAEKLKEIFGVRIYFSHLYEDKKKCIIGQMKTLTMKLNKNNSDK